MSSDANFADSRSQGDTDDDRAGGGRFDLKPERLIGDMAYGNAELLGWMVNDRGIEPHVPVWDRTQRDDGTLSSSDFNGTNRPTNTAARRERHCESKDARSRTCYPHYQGRHHHPSASRSRLCELPDEGALLPGHSDAEDRSQRP